jgi:hypothetical protein
VPRSRFAAFWSLVQSCLAPGGRVFLIDNRNDPHPTEEFKDPYVVHREPDLDRRRLHSGSEYRVVEVFYEPEELQSLLRHHGWWARLDATRWFIFGEACPAGAGQLNAPDAAPDSLSGSSQDAATRSPNSVWRGFLPSSMQGAADHPMC